MTSMDGHPQIPWNTSKGTQGTRGGALGNSEVWRIGADPANDLAATLHRDHVAVGQLIQALAATDRTEERCELWAQVYAELTAHTEAEEQVVYSAVLRHGWALSEQQAYAELAAHPDGDGPGYAPVLRECEMRSKVEDAIEEHDTIRRVLEEIEFIGPFGAEFLDKVAELARAFESHVNYEEWKLLPLAEQLFDASVLEKIEREFVFRKRLLLEQATAVRGPV